MAFLCKQFLSHCTGTVNTIYITHFPKVVLVFMLFQIRQFSICHWIRFCVTGVCNTNFNLQFELLKIYCQQFMMQYNANSVLITSIPSSDMTCIWVRHGVHVFVGIDHLLAIFYVWSRTTITIKFILFYQMENNVT